MGRLGSSALALLACSCYISRGGGGSGLLLVSALTSVGDDLHEAESPAGTDESGKQQQQRWQWDSASGAGWRPRARRRGAFDKEGQTDWLGELDGGAGAGLEMGVGEANRALLELDEETEVARDREYLNGLVTKSATKTREQACNVAFAKTHKTASTTLAMILVRYARRHDKKLASFGGNHVSAIPLDEAVKQTQASGRRVDVMHYHYSDSGSFNMRWAEATSNYEQIMQENQRINYITIMRNHRAHFLSYYYFFVQPEVQLSVQHFFSNSGAHLQKQRDRLVNPLSLEFGIHTEAELDHFIAHELPDFRLVILTEEFDEGLVVMRRLLGWDMIDLTYSRMMETKTGTRRWDGKDLKSVPHFEDLPLWVQKKIDNHTKLDEKLYAAAAELYRKTKEVVAAEVAEDLVEFQELQKVMNGYMERNTSSEAAHWYSGSVQPYLGGPPFYPF